MHPVAGSGDSEGGTEVSLEIDEGNGWLGWGGESLEPFCTQGHLSVKDDPCTILQTLLF